MEGKQLGSFKAVLLRSVFSHFFHTGEPGPRLLLKRWSLFSQQAVPDGKIVFHFHQSHLWYTSFRPSRPFFGRWNWFVHKGETPFLDEILNFFNFAYHLPKPWTYRFARVVINSYRIFLSTEAYLNLWLRAHREVALRSWRYCVVVEWDLAAEPL